MKLGHGREMGERIGGQNPVFLRIYMRLLVQADEAGRPVGQLCPSPSIHRHLLTAEEGWSMERLTHGYIPRLQKGANNTTCREPLFLWRLPPTPTSPLGSRQLTTTHLTRRTCHVSEDARWCYLLARTAPKHLGTASSTSRVHVADETLQSCQAARLQRPLAEP